jgi:cytochrome c5
MALSPGPAAFTLVVVTGFTLFLIGTPAERSRDLALAPEPEGQPAQAAAAPTAAPATAPAPAEVSAAGITLRSVSFELPASARTFPGGPAADAINANCLTCHSAGMVLTQPALDRASWQDEVNKMRLTYKAPIDPDAVPAIVSYLASLKPGATTD